MAGNCRAIHEHTYFRVEHVLMFKIVMEKRGAATEYFNYAERNNVRCNIRGRLFFNNSTNKLSRDISVLKNRNYYLQRDYFFVSFFLFSSFLFFLFFAFMSGKQEMEITDETFNHGFIVIYEA